MGKTVQLSDARKAKPKGKPRGRPFQKGHAGAWKPGQSGNPNGRPKADKPIRDAAREHADEAIKALVGVLKDTEAPASAKVAAATALLDRAYGRPTQTTELTGADGGPLKLMTWADTLKEAAEVARQEGE